MDSSLEDTKCVVISRISEETGEIIEKLVSNWTVTFGQDVCQPNLLKLIEHVKTFYNDIFEESDQRQKKIQKDIERLHEEAVNLQRLLHVEISLDFNEENNIPLYEMKMRLDKKLVDLRETLQERKSEIMELLLEQDSLCEELDAEPKPLLDDPLPTEEELADFRLHIDNLKEEKVKRTHQVSVLRREIKCFLSELQIQMADQDEERLLNDRGIKLTLTNITDLQLLHKRYLQQVEELKESIATMKKKLEKLWDYLEVDSSIRNKFSKYTNYSRITYEKLNEELQRCEEERKQNMKKFVDKIREEIIEWWNRTLKSDIERSRFTNFTSDSYTEDLLTLHELELEDLKRYYSENEKIFSLIEERKSLWERMNALEARALEPGRYNNRGGQLLKEEKERKMIANKLPKIEEELKVLVNQYEEDHKRKFLVFGEDILGVIAQDWEKKRAEKEKHMSARKNAITPIKQQLRTPMSTSQMSRMKGVLSNISSVPTSCKRKLPQTEIKKPKAKRNLLMNINEVNNIPNLQKNKSSAKKQRVIAITLNRRSNGHIGHNNGNRSSRSRKRTSSRNIKVPKVCVNDNSYSNTTDATETKESTSYEIFEEHFVKDPSSRSSVLKESNYQLRTRNMRKHNINLPDPRLVVNLEKEQSLRTIVKSPGLSRNGSPVTAVPGPSGRKLTTRNLPILI